MMAGRWIKAQAVAVGRVYPKLRMADQLGSYEVEARHFLHEDGRWYRVDPPTQIVGRVTHAWADGGTGNGGATDGAV